MPAIASEFLKGLAVNGIRFEPALGSEPGNLTGHQTSSSGTIFPAATGQVRYLVSLATATGTPLYPVSRGLNWGYGSRCAPRSGAVAVDLSALSEIKLMEGQPVAVVGPGVTQQMLYEHLQAHAPQWTFNVTGSGRDTSLIGNALDRGVGYLGPRREDLFGLEIVTGTGEVLHTGFRRLGESSPLAHAHPYGLGPMLDGLFFQGNFGIVTSACFRLQPRRPCEVALSLTLKDPARLSEFIDVLAALKREKIISSVTHIGNRARTHASLAAGAARYLMDRCHMPREAAIREAGQCLQIVSPSEWASLGGASGSKAEVRARVREARARTRHLAGLRVVSSGLLDAGFGVMDKLRGLRWARAQAAAIAGVRPLHGLALGIPTDAPIENLLFKFDAEHLPASRLDESPCGLLFINPALPLNGREAVPIVQESERIARVAGFELYMTLNIETDTSLVGVFNLLFDRRDAEQTRRAHQCADDMLAFFQRVGIQPYRARADMMSSIVDANDPYWQTVRRLKEVFDPQDIIAPGRYNL
ncbi:FAD-binding oxidoreductase [Uliginosibacterium sp. H1]|uniref:FAD-binding oxidoreductase n=1 Tax=Uliginosibacterium sp. H1 TaxID=3114757 RepID=UPI002E16E1F7|nr:FAD-binding protein [Uliginosibacterium sp. H1]